MLHGRAGDPDAADERYVFCDSVRPRKHADGHGDPDGAATQPGTNGADTDFPTINATNGASAGGTITWVLFAPSNGGCTDTRTTTPTSRAVNGNGVYSVTYTTLLSDPVGTYTFVANYGGNGPNTNAAATVTCAAPGANETVTITGEVSVRRSALAAQRPHRPVDERR